jgi:hypothetical protein
MDPDGIMWLTAKVSVVEVCNDSDMSNMAIRSTQGQTRELKPKSKQKNGDEDESSDDDWITGGAELLNTYKHFHMAINPAIHKDSSHSDEGVGKDWKVKKIRTKLNLGVGVLQQAVGIHANI